MRPCKIVYVKQQRGSGWKWRSVALDDGPVRSSEETFELFYECVVAARASGYTPSPALKCS